MDAVRFRTLKEIIPPAWGEEGGRTLAGSGNLLPTSSVTRAKALELLQAREADSFWAGRWDALNGVHSDQAGSPPLLRVALLLRESLLGP